MSVCKKVVWRQLVSTTKEFLRLYKSCVAQQCARGLISLYPYEAQMVQLAHQEGLHEGLVLDVWRCPLCEMDVKLEHMQNHVQSNRHVKRKQWLLNTRSRGFTAESYIA